MKGDEVTKSGIILPDTVEKEKPEKGTVVAVGPGKLLENGTLAPIAVKVGDTVLFKKYSPDEIKVSPLPWTSPPAGETEDEELLVIREEDILGIIE
jgi:chaperonin GroES